MSAVATTPTVSPEKIQEMIAFFQNLAADAQVPTRTRRTVRSRRSANTATADTPPKEEKKTKPALNIPTSARRTGGRPRVWVELPAVMWEEEIEPLLRESNPKLAVRVSGFIEEKKHQERQRIKSKVS